MIYYSSILYVNEAVAAIDLDGGDVASTLDGTQGAVSRRRIAAPLRTASPLSECVESAYNVVSVFTSLDLQTIRCLPTIFLIRVIHAIVFLVNFNIGTSLKQIPKYMSPSRNDSRVEHQLDDMIEIMASWGSDWPACRLIQILTRLRRQLRNNQNKLGTTCGSSSRNSCNSHEDQDTQSSTPTIPEVPTPLPYQGLGQQPLSFKPAEFSIQESTSYGDPTFWDTFPEQVSPDKRTMSPHFSHSSMWKAQQPQQHGLLPEESFSGEGIPPMAVFADNSKHESWPVSMKSDTDIHWKQGTCLT